ncbi:MAG: hypothetical protein O2992_06705 [Gemmatimonadetes bacterium]|jgi:hypothetical protein|nr:hypothetical protein [Gemmatimonadota bacterium]
MLKYLRGKRFDIKTTVILLVIAGLLWGAFAYANIKNFVPDEFMEPVETRE